MRIFLILTLIFTLVSINAGEGTYLQEIVGYLASSKLEGRRAGTLGNEFAALFIKDELEKNKIQTQIGEFTIFTQMTKEGKNSASIDSVEENQFEPLSFSMSGELIRHEVIFAGYGISIPKSDLNLRYDDYQNVDVKDKVVLIMTGDPAVKNPDSIFRKSEYSNYNTISYKLSNAIKHGAVGVILVEDPLSNLNYPSEKRPHFNKSEGGGERFKIIAGQVTNKWLNNFLGEDAILNLQEMIRVSEKPQSFDTGLKINMVVSLKKETGRVKNVWATVPGSDPILSKEVIVVGAHFDHLGYGGESSHDNTGEIHFGADDNASGVAAVLSLAKKIAETPQKRTVVFAFFNAEEIGLLGSTYFLDSFTANVEKWGAIKAMINFDMVGRYVDSLAVMGVNSAHEFRSLLSPLKSDLKIELKNDAVYSSDHASFLMKKIPSLNVTTGAHEDYHTPRDTAEKLNYLALEKIVEYFFDGIRSISGGALTYNINFGGGDEDDRPRGYGAHLGCAPEFAQPDEVVGVMCKDTTPNSPAEKIGIVKGDIVVRVGDIEIKNIYDLVFALKYYRAGDEVVIAWLREGKVISKKTTLTKKS